MSKYHLSIYEKGLYPKGKRKCIVLHMFQVGDMSNSPASLRLVCMQPRNVGGDLLPHMVHVTGFLLLLHWERGMPSLDSKTKACWSHQWLPGLQGVPRRREVCTQASWRQERFTERQRRFSKAHACSSRPWEAEAGGL